VIPYVHPEQGARGLTLTQFLQTVLVGVTALPGELVRPKWQIEPPKSPDVLTNWMAFGIDSAAPDFSAWLSPPEGGGRLQNQRNEDLTISLSIYGPAALETYGLIRDGLQIPQNRFAMFSANIGYTDLSEARHVPDLVNQRWIDRYEASLLLKRQVQRVYPVLTFVSATGIIYVPDVTPDYELRWSVPTT
jgi:hypothetical protein